MPFPQYPHCGIDGKCGNDGNGCPHGTGDDGNDGNVIPETGDDDGNGGNGWPHGTGGDDGAADTATAGVRLRGLGSEGSSRPRFW